MARGAMRIRCAFCWKMARANALGTLREDVFAITFPEAQVCEACGELMYSLFSELASQLRAGVNITRDEQVERFIARLRGRPGRPVEPVSQEPAQLVDDLLRDMKIKPEGDS